MNPTCYSNTTGLAISAKLNKHENNLQTWRFHSSIKKQKLFLLALTIIISSGCSEFINLFQTESILPLTETEAINGLKEALTTGAKNSASILSAENGYFGDDAIKILLPEEAKVIIDNISRLPSGEQLLNDVILRINRAAEDAAKEIVPIFAGAVQRMTIKDAFNILNGDDNAATMYLHRMTYNELYTLYKPKIQNSTEKEIVGNISTKDSWDALTTRWNSVAGSLAGRLAGLKTVTTDLDDFLTNKALLGIFMKMEIEEMKIRKEVSARVTPLLRRVFGSLDNKT